MLSDIILLLYVLFLSFFVIFSGQLKLGVFQKVVFKFIPKVGKEEFLIVHDFLCDTFS